MKKFFLISCMIVLLLSLTACGDERKTEYRLQEDGKSYLLYCYADKDGLEVVIPDTYNDLPVTAIGGGAFMDTNIKSVVIPEGVTSVGEYAFSGCHSLVTVSLPSTLTDLGMGAFNDCQKLEDVTVPSGVKDLMPGVFSACHSLKNVQLPEGLLTINDQAFEWCYALEKITIPETVISIGMSAFTECHSLKELHIPDSVALVHAYAITGCPVLERIYLGENVEMMNAGGVGTFHTGDYGTEIHQEMFALCPSLKSIEVAENNPNYASVDGNLFSADGSELIRYAVGKTEAAYTVPEGVTKIAEGAFNGCSLDDSSSLETVYISSNVTQIAQSVFTGCKKLTAIRFSGTMAQWDAAKEDTEGMVLTMIIDDVTHETHTITGDYGDFTVYCTDGEVSGKTYTPGSSSGEINGDFSFNFG